MGGQQKKWKVTYDGGMRAVGGGRESEALNARTGRKKLKGRSLLQEILQDTKSNVRHLSIISALFCVALGLVGEIGWIIFIGCSVEGEGHDVYFAKGIQVQSGVIRSVHY